MRLIGSWRYGYALECGRTIVSLGWQVWGVDAPRWHAIAHVWPPRLFVGKGLGDVP